MNCLGCYAEIPRGNLFPSEYKDRKYCSHKCFGLYLKRLKPRDTTSKSCTVCGAEFTRRSNEAVKRWNQRKFCAKRKCVASGDQHGMWKGGRCENRGGGGYVAIGTGSGKYEFEHRQVAERILGRKLLPNEVVHHINCDKSDNRPENLQVCTRGEHKRIHDEMGKLWAQWQYGIDPMTMVSGC